MPRKDPYRNVKLYEELNAKGLNDFEIVRVVAQEAKRINEKAMINGTEHKEKPVTIAMRNVISDTGRNFSFITGLIFSGIIASIIYLIGTKINQ